MHSSGQVGTVPPSLPLTADSSGGWSSSGGTTSWSVITTTHCTTAYSSRSEGPFRLLPPWIAYPRTFSTKPSHGRLYPLTSPSHHATRGTRSYDAHVRQHNIEQISRCCVDRARCFRPTSRNASGSTTLGNAAQIHNYLPSAADENEVSCLESAQFRSDRSPRHAV